MIQLEQYRQWDIQNPRATPNDCDLCPLNTACNILIAGSDDCIIVWRKIRANLKIAQLNVVNKTK